MPGEAPPAPEDRADDRAVPPGRLHAGVPAWRAALVALVACGVALLLRAVLAPLLGSQPLFLLAYPASVVAAWYGGFLPGAAVTLALAVLTPWLAGAAWDASTLATVALYLPFGLLIAALCQSLHDARTPLQQRIRLLQSGALSEARRSAALDATGLTLFELDAELRFVWVQNPPLGYGTADLIGRRAEDLFSPAQAERLRAAWLEVLRGGAPLRRDFPLTGPRGTRVLEQVIAPLREPGRAGRWACRAPAAT